MQLSLKDATELAVAFCVKLGFPQSEAEVIADNIIEAEISGKSSHGFGNLLWFRTEIDEGGVNHTHINQSKKPIQIIKETPVSLFINGQNRTGYVVIKKALDLSLAKVKKSYLVATALTNTAPTTGF